MIERLDAFMARANAAYYATQDPYADFTTAPEISQAFGEVLGLWAAVSWTMLGRPSPVTLAEAGPGRGTLMVDALRAIGQAMPEFLAAARPHLIETSPRLRAVQAERLPGAIWLNSLDELPDAPLLLIGNEFLDALPIRQIVRRGQVWTERFVGSQGFVEYPVVDGWGLAGGSATPANDILPRQAFPPAGSLPDEIREICEPAHAVVAALADRFRTRPGAALFLDYGPEHSAPGDSLQAIGGGRPADPLSPAGSVDLTAHVDFAALASVARAAGASVHGPTPQGMFLARLGLFQRTNRLARGLPPAQAAAMMDTARRLGEPDRMGRLFKAMAIAGADCPELPGFASEDAPGPR